MNTTSLIQDLITCLSHLQRAELPVFPVFVIIYPNRFLPVTADTVQSSYQPSHLPLSKKREKKSVRKLWRLLNFVQLLFQTLLCFPYPLPCCAPVTIARRAACQHLSPITKQLKRHESQQKRCLSNTSTSELASSNPPRDSMLMHDILHNSYLQYFT